MLLGRGGLKETEDELKGCMKLHKKTKASRYVYEGQREMKGGGGGE